MIWRIFNKDWKLLWPLVVGVASVHFALAAVTFKLGRFGGNPVLSQMVNPLIMIGILGTGFLIASVVHQDAIPGVRQDWLVRPVKRRDLLPGGRARIEANNLEIWNEGHGESEKRIHQWIHVQASSMLR